MKGRTLLGQSSVVLLQFAEYTVPDELGDALKARKSTQVPSSITVKRKRESLSGVGRHEEDSKKSGDFGSQEGQK